MQLPGLKLVDLSVPLEHLATSEPLPAKIQYIRHDGEGLAQMQQFFGVTPADLVYSNGEGWAVEQIEAITHTGTHVDAPYHYGAKSEGRPARTIDEVPSNGALRRVSCSTCGTRRLANSLPSTIWPRPSNASSTL